MKPGIKVDKNLSAKKAAPQNTPEPEQKKKETPLEFTASMAAVLIVGLFIITFNLQAFEIPSSSMEKTLLIGDHVFVDRITFAPTTHWMPLAHYREVRRGDIVVFLSPAQAGLYVVKRVIGIPGDKIHLRNGVVYRNGEQMEPKYVVRDGSYDPYRDNFPSVPADDSRVPLSPEWQLALPSYIQGEDLVVPPDHYFAMGDNRDVSLDSRYWGFIPRENLVGRPLFVYWSFETPADQWQKDERDMGSRAGFIAHEILHFFDETRWSRTLRRVQ